MSKTQTEAPPEVADAGAVTKAPIHPTTGAVVWEKPAAPSEAMSMMMMMERIAKNKEVDVAKMKEVKEMGMSLLADQRRAAFDDTLAQLQSELPTITAKGTIEIREKDARGGRTGDVIQSSKYARWEDINEAIKPVLQRHGFALRFVTGLAEDGRVKVTGILSGHGHREESTMILQHDATGSKNAVQAVGSSTSYGKRYTASALLNLTSRGEDDDGHIGGGKPINAPDLITSDQITQLMDECKRVGCAPAKFLAWAEVSRFEDIRIDRFEGCMAGLASFRRAK